MANTASPKLTSAEERFHHLVVCISRLHSALETLRTIKTASPDNPLVSPAFRFALVEYTSPFTSSKGKLGTYKLGDTHVPPEYLELHNRIVSARHQIHAHSDLAKLNATFKATGNRANPTAEIRGTYIDELKELPHIDDIIALLNALITSMYVDRDAQLEALNS